MQQTSFLVNVLLGIASTVYIKISANITSDMLEFQVAKAS